MLYIILQHIPDPIGILQHIPDIIGTIIGVITGFTLNIAKDHFDHKPKLSFCINIMHDESLLDPPKRTKTSFSEYVITLYNYGRIPVILENLTLYRKKKYYFNQTLFIDKIINNYTAIMPYESVDIRINQQEHDTLNDYISKCNHLKFSNKYLPQRMTSFSSKIDTFFQNKLKYCTIIATTIQNKEIRGKLDLTIISSIATAND